METLYIRLNDFWNGLCPYCGLAVEELYPDAGHIFRSVDKWINAVTYWYECTVSPASFAANVMAPPASTADLISTPRYSHLVPVDFPGKASYLATKAGEIVPGVV